MPSITPIPSSRVSSLLIQSRLLTQMQFDQQELLRVQTQVATGQRIFLPSDDANAAQRSITLQSLIERKTQIATNLQTNDSYLSATDSALANVSSLLADIRGSALSVSDSLSSDIQRQAVAEEVDRAIQQLVDVGNQQFRGRYLFSGTQTTVRPFEQIDGQVQYNGNDGVLQSYSDLAVLFETSVNGDEVFGALATEVKGTVDLDPVLTGDTLLSDLYGGQGITLGAIRISDGSDEQVIDLSNAVTLNDVKRAIETNPPAGRQVEVVIGSSGLNISLDSAGGGNLTITDVGNSKTAAELGIREPVGAGVGPINGSDLRPALKLTTRLQDILGSQARTRIVSPGQNNDIVLTATSNGAQFNGAVVQFVDDSLLLASNGLAAGNETAAYDTSARSAQAAFTLPGTDNDLVLTAASAGTAFNNVTIRVVTQAGGLGPEGVGASYNAGSKELTVTLDSLNGSIDRSDIQTAINNEGTFTAAFDNSVESLVDGTVDGTTIVPGTFGNTGNSGGAANTLYVNIDPGFTTAKEVVNAINAQVTEFSAETDVRDISNLLQQGEGIVDLSATGITAGGAGTDLDLSGIRFSSGSQSVDLDFSTAETVEDLLNIVNGSELGTLAEINNAGDGINIRSRRSGGDFSIGELGGSTATQLGLRTYLGNTELGDLNFGLGVNTQSGADFIIERKDGVQIAIDATGLATIDDVIDEINNHVDNAGGLLQARLAVNGNGIELIDPTVSVPDAFGNPTVLNVQRVNESLAAIDLGFVERGQAGSATPDTVGGNEILQSADTNPLETEGVFNALVRLQNALVANDLPAIGRALERLDAGAEQLVFTRGEIGARQQSLDVLQIRLEDEQIELKEALSLELDVDLTEAISNLSARQFAFEASLRTSANLMQLSLLNFI